MATVQDWTTGVFVPHGRSIGGIVAQVTVSESERDELTVTEHPIEQGAPISDHAFKRPSEVTIRAGWSASRNGVTQDLSADSGVYQYLLSWQAHVENPFDLYTGKRVYKDMLMVGLTVETDETSEFALMATITCRQVIIVSTNVTQVAMSSSSENHTDPANTGPAAERGTQNAQSVDSATTTNVEQLGLEDLSPSVESFSGIEQTG
jgi:hypothetical protein